jgi:conjugal transfer mating pair stabilization protein TraN
MCIEPGAERTVNGMPVYKPCWKYKYIKKCNAPSKNDCHTIPSERCNFRGDECLATMQIGNKSLCLNVQKFYLCTRVEHYEVNRSELIMDPDNKEAAKDLICKAFCIDGNCPEVYKANQEANNELAGSIAQLQMLKEVKDGMVDPNTLNFDIFKANVRRCNRTIIDFTNCCTDAGWGQNLGLAQCFEDETQIAKEWRLGRCEYVGEHCSGGEIFGICIVKKKTYCCFPNVLAKVIHKGARNQLGRSLGSSEYPQCNGFNLTEIEKIDFSQIDFKEFFEAEVVPKMNEYSSKDNESLMQRSFPSIDRSSGKDQHLLMRKE